MLPKVKGAANANAHGQATISTDVKTSHVCDGSLTHQYTKVAHAINRIIHVNLRAARSIAFWYLLSVIFLNASLFHKLVRWLREVIFFTIRITGVPISLPPA